MGAVDPQRAVTDADREAAVAILRRHAGAGTIDLDQFGDRTGRVLAASTVGQLEAVFADLPGGPPTLAPPSPPVAARAVPTRSRPVVPWAARMAPIAPLAVLFVTIWALTGFGYFWPVWPILGISIGAVKGGRCWGHRRPRWV